MWGGGSGSFLKVPSRVVWQGACLSCAGFNVKGVPPQVRVSMSGGDPSSAGVYVVPHEDPCVWVLPGGRPVGTLGLTGTIGAQLQVSQQ